MTKTKIIRKRNNATLPPKHNDIDYATKALLVVALVEAVILSAGVTLAWMMEVI